MRSVNFKTILFVFLLTYFYIRFVAAENENAYLLSYLKSLNKIIQFTTKNRDFVGVNLGFGLFLAKVNLKASLDSSDVLTGSFPSFLLNMIHEVDRPLDYFRSRVSKKNYNYDEKVRSIVSLMYESSWTEKIRKYTNKKLWDPSDNTQFLRHSKWEDYLENIQADGLPTPQQSDMCLASIGEHSINTEKEMTPCELCEDCYGVALNGTNYGFSFTHRILLILAGHFGRNCYIFSQSRDQALIQEMCAWALKEAHYIAEQGYLLRDLMMEQIALCSLYGYKEFIQPTWISKFLELQSDVGCFGVHADGRCHEHVTGVAAASTAAAIRYLIQEMYGN